MTVIVLSNYIFSEERTSFNDEKCQVDKLGGHNALLTNVYVSNTLNFILQTNHLAHSL